MAISMLKIRRPLGRLIFNMGIATPGKTVFLIETAPWFSANLVKSLQISLGWEMKYTGVRLLNTLQWLDFKVGSDDDNPSVAY